MENVCHTLCGLALGRAGVDRLGPLVVPTLLVAANFPDCDIVVRFTEGKAGYLCHHRGITHALIGLAFESVFLAAAVSGFARLKDLACASFGRLWAAAAIGLASHLLLDSLNTYGVRPWLPFLETWHYNDLAFILDPWMWIGFSAAACLGGPRTRTSVVGWCGFYALAGLFVWVHPRSNAGIAAVWSLLAAGVLTARALGVGRERRAAVALAAIGLTLLYLAALGTGSRVADARARDHVRKTTRTAVRASTCSPAPGIPWQFRAVIDSAGKLHHVEVDLRTGEARTRLVLPTRLDHPALESPALRATDEYRTWRIFARHPFVADGVRGLVLGDGRYAPFPESAWCNFVVPPPADLAPRAR